VIVLSRDQLIARLVGRYPLRLRDDGSAWVELRDAGLEDERVPRVFLPSFGPRG
jgi:hypothetical protein